MATSDGWSNTDSNDEESSEPLVRYLTPRKYRITVKTRSRSPTGLINDDDEPWSDGRTTSPSRSTRQMKKVSSSISVNSNRSRTTERQSPIIIGEFYLRRPTDDMNSVYSYRPKHTQVPVLYKGVMGGSAVRQRALTEIQNIAKQRSRTSSASSMKRIPSESIIKHSSPRNISQFRPINLFNQSSVLNSHISVISLKNLSDLRDRYRFSDSVIDDSCDELFAVIGQEANGRSMMDECMFQYVTDAATETTIWDDEPRYPARHERSRKSNSKYHTNMVTVRSHESAIELKRLTENQDEEQEVERNENITSSDVSDTDNEDEQIIESTAFQKPLSPRQYQQPIDPSKSTRTSKQNSESIKNLYTSDPMDHPAPFQPFLQESLTPIQPELTRNDARREKSKSTFFTRLFSLFRRTEPEKTTTKKNAETKKKQKSKKKKQNAKKSKR